RPVGRTNRHLVGGLRSHRQGRLLRAALRQADRRHRQAGGAVLERALRPSLLPAEELVHGRTQAGGQAVLLYGRRRHLLSEQLDAGAREVDEDDGEPALRRVLHVRRQQAALLVGAGLTGRAAQRDRSVHSTQAAGRDDDVLVAVLSVRQKK